MSETASDATRARVGFIGLGLMGSGMARNLAKAGFPLAVYNRTRARAEELAGEEGGVVVVDTPRAAAESADVVITMVSDVPDVEQVYLAANGIIEVARPGLLCVDMGTVGADCARRVHKALSEKGADFLDAPVSGGSWGAQQGTLSIMAGGSESGFQKALPVFEAMGKKIVHCGPVGMGQATKLVNQAVVALTLEAATEGVLLAEKSGADVGKVLDAVGAGAAGSWTWANLGPRIAARDFAPGFKVAHMIKDLRLTLEAAESLGLQLPGVRLVLQKLQEAQAKNPDGGELGTQSLITALE
jgi:3-hydroxyisobutyrate dehydrogenase-like beta-hydroxyacid dehydrogenase